MKTSTKHRRKYKTHFQQFETNYANSPTTAQISIHPFILGDHRKIPSHRLDRFERDNRPWPGKRDTMSSLRSIIDLYVSYHPNTTRVARFGHSTTTMDDPPKGWASGLAGVGKSGWSDVSVR